jgi:hypothetical protein
VDRSSGFFGARHTFRGHAEAREVCDKWRAALRAIKDANPVGLLPQDLLGG